ncbi:alpha/beta hydrolase family protein [Roseimaritima sediminicola]|uniref:alpha/beta hydrolase family protein n=1 Tax=Roseimaritima sediminicola TaxID=2662066 RepID=UPI001386E56F|nr:acetylxylan esterase [Roseimaritima sediminicola]
MANGADKPWQADPELVEKKSRPGSEINYHESKVPSYDLPDPLVDSAGEAVTAESWPQRREELMELFREHVYGRRPSVPYRLNAINVARHEGVFEGAADARELKLEITSGGESYAFTLLLFTPTGKVAGDESKRPAIVFLNNRDFPTLKQAIEEPNDFWPVRQICERGFVAASVSTKQIDPDAKGKFDEGLRGFFARVSGTGPDEHSWGALSAWGWGLSRVVDYLLTMPEVDPDRIAVVGHSRGGKAALWAAAEDPRIAVAYSNNSGCGGAALSRREYGETVKRITTAFPYWFCKHFASYGDRVAELPVDQHQLIALIAPRSVYVTSATEDLWADPRGEYLSLINAAPVFERLGKSAVSNPQMPAADQPRTSGQTGYHIRSGIHNLTPTDWQHFMDFMKTLED